jgi:hypothetical protein
MVSGFAPVKESKRFATEIVRIFRASTAAQFKQRKVCCLMFIPVMTIIRPDQHSVFRITFQPLAHHSISFLASLSPRRHAGGCGPLYVLTKAKPLAQVVARLAKGWETNG